MAERHPHHQARVSVVCTDYAMCCALGMDTASVWQALHDGGSVFSTATLTPELDVACGALPAPLPDVGLPAGADSRQNRLGIHLANQLDERITAARRRWGPARVAVIIGTSTGGLYDTELALQQQSVEGSLPPNFDLDRTHTMAAAASAIAERWALTGPRYVVSTACSSGAKALAAAKRMIACGLADAVLAGAFDTLCKLTLRGFAGLGILSQRGCRPFSSERDGIVIGEGGALLMLERQGQGPAVLVGTGESSDAHQMSAPHPDGLGAELAMVAALAEAGVPADRVALVNAHGTGTRLNDAAEAAAIARVFGDRVPVVSTKAHTGHMLGAAGALEAALCVASLEHGLAPSSRDCSPLDRDLGIHVATEPVILTDGMVLSNSLAFGGNNASVLWGRP